MKKKLLAMAFSLTFSCLTVADSTSEVDRSFPAEDTPAALEALWAETNARLDLSDAQAEKVAPIYVEALHLHVDLPQIHLLLLVENAVRLLVVLGVRTLNLNASIQTNESVWTCGEE